MGDVRRSGRHSESGIATIWSLAWLAVCLVVGWVAIALAAAVAAQHHVDASADLTAVSAAASLQQGHDPCAEARRVATANEVRLSRCQVAGEDVVVTVSDRVHLAFGLHPTIIGRARAGPR